MLGMLYSKGVITLREKEGIESKSVQHDKMICFLDNVITRSLLNNISKKFKGFLEVMEESGDPILTDMAKTLGKSISSKLNYVAVCICMFLYHCEILLLLMHSICDCLSAKPSRTV